MKGQGTTGFHGKLPNLGDFVTRRLPADFVQPWDLWLRESLAASRAQLGDGWLDTYLISPLWRFVLTPGVAGQGTWAGVLMPSVDRVGRYFPLTLACPLPLGTDLVGLLGESPWFEQAETLALRGLEDDAAIESFDALTLALGAPTGPLSDAGAQPSGAVRANAWRLAAHSPRDLREVSPLLLARALDQVFCAYSLWWSSGSDRVDASFLACQGLPPPDGFSALLGGDWSGHGWWEFGGAGHNAIDREAP